jgi:hypothetical protein
MVRELFLLVRGPVGVSRKRALVGVKIWLWVVGLAVFHAPPLSDRSLWPRYGSGRGSETLLRQFCGCRVGVGCAGGFVSPGWSGYSLRSGLVRESSLL